MADAEAWTVGRLLTWTTDYLKNRGVESPRLDAEVLLATARRCQRIDLYAAYAEPAGDDLRAKFRDLVRRRAEGTPVAYLVGHKEFYSLSFRVTPDVLIPRPETEHVVIALVDHVKALQDAADERAAIEIADVGTGSGILAICAARHIENCRITAIDVSPAALDVARTNAAEHGVVEKIEFVESDLFEAVSADRTFDFIVSNPPYITTAEMEALPPDVRLNEPHLALHAGPHGTEVIERLVAQAAQRLKPCGWLIFETSPGLRDAAEEIVEKQAELEPGPTLKDLANLPRVIQARKIEV